MTQEQFAQKLMDARPGAQWMLNGTTYADLVWLDKVQTKPTPQELGL